MTVTVTLSSASHSPLVEPEKAEKALLEKPLSTSSQPFTDLLTEATSKISIGGSDKPEVLNKKGESTKAAPLKNEKEEHSGPPSKKSVVVDISTQMVPVIVAPIPLTITKTAPVGTLAIAHVAKEPTSQQSQIGTVANNEVQDSQSLSMTNVVVPEDPHLKVIGNIESDLVDIAKPVTSTDQTLTLPATSAKPDSAHSEITMSSPLLVRDVVAAPEVHSSMSVAIEFTQDVKPVRTREPLIRVGTKTVEPMSEHASSILTRTQLEVVPVWPSQSPVVAFAVNTVTTPSHITQSSPHFLDVGALAGAISRPLDEARGGYTVMIAMHPLELGHLQAAVTLRGSDLHVLITAQTQVGHDALTNAVDTLKTELSRGGVNVNVTLQDPGSQPRGGDQPQITTVPREVFVQDESVVIAAPVLSENQINLVL